MVPNSNGKQHHRTALEIIAQAQARRMRPYHWEEVGIETLIRPRTLAENGAAVDEGNRISRDMEEYKGTADEPGAIEGYRLRLRYALPCILDPETKEPIFAADDLDAVIEGLDTPAVNSILAVVDEVSNFTKAQAEESAKNSVETDDGSTSSVSPSTAATRASSPTPIR